MAAEGQEKLARKWKLHVYHRLPRLRLAITKSDIDEALRYGEQRGWKLENIKLWNRYIVYPRFRRFKDGRIILPAFFVEYNRLRPDGIYSFAITYLVPPPLPLQTIHMKIKPYALVYKEPTPLKREYEKRFECLPEDCTVLTPTDIKRMDELKVGDDIYSVDLSNMETQIDKITAIRVTNSNENLLRFYNRNCDIRTTKNHHLIYKTLWSNPIREEIADKLPKTGYWYFIKPQKLPQKSRDEEAIDLHQFCINRRMKELPEIRVLREQGLGYRKIAKIMHRSISTIWLWLNTSMGEIKRNLVFNLNDFLELLGWYISEGSICRNKQKKHRPNYEGDYRIAISEPKSSKYRSEIVDLFSRMKISYNNTDKSSILSFHQELWRTLRHYGGIHAHGKHINHELFNLSKNKLAILLDSLVKGDGSFYGKRRVYTTVSDRLKDDIIWLATYLGYSASATLQKFNANLPQGGTYFCRRWVINMTPSIGHTKGLKINEVPYNGKLYDITVEKNHNFFAGYKGKFILVGNCTYNIDTLRQSETGEIHRNDPLTRIEVEACWDDFLINFRWVTFPPETIETAEGWTTEFEFTDQAKGAFLKSISIREDGVEVYHKDFEPPIQIYEVSEDENKEFLKRAGREA